MSDRDLMILGKLILTFGCLLGIPLWELWKLRRDQPDPGPEVDDEETVR